MISKNDLELQIGNLVQLNSMITTYEEIAASRIKQSRESVLRSRSFMSDISLVFFEVIASYRKQVDILMKKRNVTNLKDLSFINKNGKTLYLLISANTGLYGNITQRTFDLFISNLKKETNPVDIAIIGKLGEGMWQSEKMKSRYLYFDFPDQNVNQDMLKRILDFIISYKKVVVFYGKFQSLVSQDPTFSDVTGTTPPSEQPTDEQAVKYLFEPSLEKVLEFFEKQIFESLFEQVVRESQLAKISSRMTTLNKATDNIKNQLTTLTSQRNRIYHQNQNKKQLQTFSSRVLWGH